MATMVEAIGGTRSGEVGTLAGAAAGAGSASVARNLLLFFAAPFIGLAYIVAFPFVGTAFLVKAALKR